MTLLVVGAVVAVAEAHYPTHGIAGGVGVALIAVGAVLAISGLGAGIVLGLLTGTTLAAVGAGAVTLSVKKGVAARHRRVRTGAEGIVGHIGVVRNWTDAGGSVALDGSLWRARPSVWRLFRRLARAMCPKARRMSRSWNLMRASQAVSLIT